MYGVAALCVALAAGVAWFARGSKPAAGDQPQVAAMQRAIDGDHQAIAQLQSQVQNNSGLSQQVQSLADRVDQLERQQGAPAANTDDLSRKIDDLTSRVSALESRPAATAAAPSDNGQGEAAQNSPPPQGSDQNAPSSQQFASFQQTLDWLSARLTRLEQGAGRVKNAAERASRVARAQAAVAALDAGRPVGDIPGAPPEVTRFANASPPTEAELRRRFPAVAAEARAASVPTGKDQSFLSRAWARLERGITVRQGDQVVVGLPDEAVIERAEDDVRSDDLADAVAELQKLSPPAKQAVAGWVDQASALIAARQALAQMAVRG